MNQTFTVLNKIKNEGFFTRHMAGCCLASSTV
jgi:hypothetical protein